MALLAFPDVESEHGKLLGIGVIRCHGDESGLLYYFWEKVFFDSWYEEYEDAKRVGEEEFGIRGEDWIEVPEFEEKFFTSEKTSEARDKKDMGIKEWLVRLKGR